MTPKHPRKKQMANEFGDRSPSIWGSVGRDLFAQTVALLMTVTQTPAQPTANDIHEFAARNPDLQVGRTLSVQQEKSLTENLAFVTASTDDPCKITALTVEEGNGGRRLTVTMAVNMGSIEDVKDGLEGIVKIMMKVAKGDIQVAESEDPATLLLPSVVSLNLARLYSRLKSTHAKRSRKTCNRPPQIPRLATALARLSPALLPASVPKSALQDLQTQARDLAATFALIEAQSSFACRSAQAAELLLKLTKQAYSLSTREETLTTLLACVPGMNPSEQTSFPKTVAKLGRYHAAAAFLVTASRKFPGLMSDIHVLTILPPAPTTPPNPPPDFTIPKLIATLYPHAPPSHRAKLTTAIYAAAGRPPSRPAAATQAVRALASQESCVHAEIQLLFHHALRYAPTTTTTTAAAAATHIPRIISASKSACYLCALFLRLDRRFFTPRTHGRLYEKWTIPDLVNGKPFPATVAAGVSAVVGRMHECLVRAVEERAERVGGKKSGGPDESVPPSVGGLTSAETLGVVGSSGRGESVVTLRRAGEVDGGGDGCGGEVGEGASSWRGGGLVRVDTQRSAGTAVTELVKTDDESDRRGSVSSQSTVGSPVMSTVKQGVAALEDRPRELRTPIANAKAMSVKGRQAREELEARGVAETPSLDGVADSKEFSRSAQGLDVMGNKPAVEQLGDGAEESPNHVVEDTLELVTHMETPPPYVEPVLDSPITSPPSPAPPAAQRSLTPMTTQPISSTDVTSPSPTQHQEQQQQQEQQLTSRSRSRSPSPEITPTTRPPPTRLVTGPCTGLRAAPMQVITAMANSYNNSSAPWSFNNVQHQAPPHRSYSRSSNLRNASRTTSSATSSSGLLHEDAPQLHGPLHMMPRHNQPQPLPQSLAPPQNRPGLQTSLQSATTSEPGSTASSIHRRLSEQQTSPCPCLPSGSGSSSSTSSSRSTSHGSARQAAQQQQQLAPSASGSAATLTSSSSESASHTRNPAGTHSLRPPPPPPAAAPQPQVTSTRSSRSNSHPSHAALPSQPAQIPVSSPVPDSHPTSRIPAQAGTLSALVPEDLSKGKTVYRALPATRPLIKIHAGKLHTTLEAEPPRPGVQQGKVCWVRLRWLEPGDEGEGVVYRVSELPSGLDERGAEREKEVDWRGWVLEKGAERVKVGFFWKDADEVGA